MMQLVQPPQIEVCRKGRRPISVLAYGEPHRMKSYFASTCPQPWLVLAFDAPGKLWAYERWGDLQITEWDLGAVSSRRESLGPIEVTDVVRPDGGFAGRIEHYAEVDAMHPRAFAQFERRIASLHRDAKAYATIILDSLTFLQQAALYRQAYDLNPSLRSDQHTKQDWYNAVTIDATVTTQSRLAFIRGRNLVVVAHASKKQVGEFGGTLVRGVSSYGKLATDIPSAYPEMYHFDVHPKAEGEGHEVLLQTQADELWTAGSAIQAPNYCRPDYEALWAPWDEAHGLTATPNE